MPGEKNGRLSFFAALCRLHHVDFVRGASFRSISVHKLFLPDFFPVDHSFDGYSAATHFALMRALVVVMMQPLIQISLQRVDAVIKRPAERGLVKLLQDHLLEPLANAVGLWRLHLCLRVINVVNCDEKLE